MNDHDSPISAQPDVTSNTVRAPVAVSAPRHLELPEILGLLAGDSQNAVPAASHYVTGEMARLEGFGFGSRCPSAI